MTARTQISDAGENGLAAAHDNIRGGFDDPAQDSAPDAPSDGAAHNPAPRVAQEGPSDAALLRAIAEEGDRSAFATLYYRYGARLKAFMIRSGAAPDQAEEAAQETLLTVWRKASTFNPGKASAAAWLFTIARNKRIDLLRRSARFEPDPTDPAFAPDPVDSAAVSIAAERRDQIVRQALATLSAEQREVIVRSFFDGMTHSDIADALGLPLGTVKSRLRLAFAKLRDALGDAFRAELDDH